MIDAVAGAKLLLLKGSFKSGNDLFQTHSWLRLPVNTVAIAQTGEFGAKVWVKTGHLSSATTPTSFV